MEFKEALKEILKIKGISALEDQSTLKLLEDYGAFDEYPVFRSITENIIATKIGEMLQNTFYYSVEDKGQAWTQMKTKLIERLPYDEVFLNLFFDEMEYAFMGYAYEKGSYDRDINSNVEEMLGQVWTDDKGVKYSVDKKRLINASEIAGTYIVNPETEYIDSYAFQQNSKIERVILPKELKKIGSHAFQICPYLNKIEFQDGISEIDECAFGGCALTEVKLPNGLHRISDALFSTCTDLLYVHIPKSVTSIGAHAFSDCHSLQYLVIPDNVSSIGDLAFHLCKSLYYVVLPAKLTSVGENIFDNCKSLRYIGIPKGTKSKFTLFMPQYANLFVEYEQAPSKKATSIINTTANIVDIEDEKLSSEVTTEELANAWTDEFGVEYSTDSKKLLKAPQNIVEYCIKDGTEVISDRAFIECSSLISITIPDSVKLLGTWCFKGCSSLTEVFLPNKIRSIPYRAFCSCSKLKRINIPDKVVKIGTEAFYGCPFESISLPENVVSIGDSAFLGCEKLSFITIPSKVSEIGINPFAGEKLKDIICKSSHFETDGVALYDRGKKRLISLFGDVRFVKIPDSVTSIGNHAFYYCQSLHSLYIPNSVITMGDELFFACMSWNYVFVPNGSLEKFKTLMPKYAFKIKEGFLPQNYEAQNVEYKERLSPKDQKEATNDKKFLYTEEMFKQEIADQEEKDLLEYGTTDEKKIAQIKKDKKDNRNYWIFIIIVGVVIYMLMGLIQKCTGSKYNPLEDNTPWQPRHTQIYKQMPSPLCHVSYGYRFGF